VSGLVDAGVAGMGAVLGEVLACAVGIMISPIPIAAASQPFSAQARINAPLFARDWLLG
jgi:hypothetical protein